jgi:hypothetical protein
MGMGPSATKLELEAKLARYRDLARQHFDSVTVANMLRATEELEKQIRDFKE